MLVRCINRPFKDNAAGVLRSVGEEWEASPERLAAINSAGYGIMAEAVSESPAGAQGEGESRPWWDGLSRAELAKAAKKRGIEVPPRASREAIVELLGNE